MGQDAAGRAEKAGTLVGGPGGTETKEKGEGKSQRLPLLPSSSARS